MSTSIEHLRRLSQRDVKDHTAIFDLYVTVGRDLEYLSIKFGMDPDDVINLLEGYGEKIRLTADQAGAVENPDQLDPAARKALKEFGVALDYSGKGRLRGLPRILVEEYVERFYPGIASEHPENDWISIESYLEHMHPGWQITMEQARQKGAAGDDGDEKGRKKARNRFRLFG